MLIQGNRSTQISEFSIQSVLPGCEFQNNQGYLYSEKLSQRIIYASIFSMKAIAFINCNGSEQLCFSFFSVLFFPLFCSACFDLLYFVLVCFLKEERKKP